MFTGTPEALEHPVTCQLIDPDDRLALVNAIIAARNELRNRAAVTRLIAQRMEIMVDHLVGVSDQRGASKRWAAEVRVPDDA